MGETRMNDRESGGGESGSIVHGSRWQSPVSRLIHASARMAGARALAKPRVANDGTAQYNPGDTSNLPERTDSELDDRRLLASAATEIYAMRRARDRYMPNGLASEPAWDILLALYSEQPNKLPVSNLCYGSGAPMTTALRWIATLDGEGLVERSKHHRDGRIVLLSLTAKGCSVIERCLKAMLAVGQS